MSVSEEAAGGLSTSWLLSGREDRRSVVLRMAFDFDFDFEVKKSGLFDFRPSKSTEFSSVGSLILMKSTLKNKPQNQSHFLTLKTEDIVVTVISCLIT